MTRPCQSGLAVPWCAPIVILGVPVVASQIGGWFIPIELLGGSAKFSKWLAVEEGERGVRLALVSSFLAHHRHWFWRFCCLTLWLYIMGILWQCPLRTWDMFAPPRYGRYHLKSSIQSGFVLSASAASWQRVFTVNKTHGVMELFSPLWF